MKFVHFCLAAFIFLLLLVGCNKRKKSDVRKITWKGVQEKGNIIQFTAEGMTEGAFLWNFGDASTATEISPQHVYNKVGRYAVSLIVNSDSDFLLTDTIDIGSANMGQLIGTKVWRSGYWDALPWPPYHTYHDLGVMSFAIDYVDVLRVAVKGDTLSYSSFYSSDSVIAFFKMEGPGDTNTLYFNQNSGVITYEVSRHVSAAAGQEKYIYTTP
jgi:PKD repeat protein